jgi:protein-tyrosine phosphatase
MMRIKTASQIALAGAPNFRDLGGIATTDGLCIRQGLLYRSEALNALTDGDLTTLGLLGIRLLCDLRTSSERRNQPNRWPPGTLPELLAVDDYAGEAEASVQRLITHAQGNSHEHVRIQMLDTYRSFPATFPETLRSLISHVIDRQEPLIIHCAAGKDRTGFVCAMLLLALGVSREAVLSDYLLSDRHFGVDRINEALRARNISCPPEVVQALCVRPEYLRAALEHIDTEHGGYESYLENHAGLTQERRTLFRKAVLDI